MSFFSMAPAVGSYRTTLHPYKLIFQMKTKVQTSDSVLIPTYGVSLSKIADVCGHAVEYDYLVGNNAIFCIVYQLIFSTDCLYFVGEIVIFCHFFESRCYWNVDGHSS